MSLINEMLSNLNDQKKQKDFKSNNSLPNSPFDSVNSFFKLRPFHWLLIFVFINIVIIIGLTFNKRHSSISPQTLMVKPKIVQQETKPIVKTGAVLAKSLIPTISYKNFHLKPALSRSKKTALQPLVKGKKSFFIKKYKKLSQRQISQKNYSRAMSLLDKNQVDVSINLLSKIIKDDQTYLLAREALVKLYVEVDKTQSALIIANQSLKLFPKNYHFLEVKASILLSKGKILKALDLLQQSAPMIDDAPDYYNLMAVAYEKLHQLSKAGAIYQKLVQVSPDNGAYWLGLALSLEDSNNVNQALSAYIRAIEANDSSPVIISYARDRISVLRG